MLALQFSLLLSQFSVSNNKTAHSLGTLMRTAAYEYNISCWTYCKQQSFQKNLFVCMTNYLSSQLHWCTESWAAEYNMWHTGLCCFAFVRYFHTQTPHSHQPLLWCIILSAICSLFTVYDWSFKPLINISPLRDLSKWLISIFRRILGNTPLLGYTDAISSLPLPKHKSLLQTLEIERIKKVRKEFPI